LETFTERIIQRYWPIDHERKVRNSLIALKQGSNFNEYVDAFQNLFNQVSSDEFSDKEKLHYFVEGLHPEAKFQIVSRKIISLNEAITVASELESCRAKSVLFTMIHYVLYRIQLLVRSKKTNLVNWFHMS
jgi:hypothetical protein